MSDHGRFVWYELMTTDSNAARTFYGTVAGWGAQDMPMPDLRYTLFTAGTAQVVGLMDLPESARSAGTPPSWVGYIAVNDVDAGADKLKRLGGTVHVGPQDIPNVGRFAMVGDPQGALLALFKTSNPEQQTPADTVAPGHVGWHELATSDWQKAWRFYSDLFGWQKADAVDMGGMGTYQMFSHAGQPVGALYDKRPDTPVPFWLYYINVADIDAATARSTLAGGQVVAGPMEVPGGSWIMQARDPQGAMFALVARKGSSM